MNREDASRALEDRHGDRSAELVRLLRLERAIQEAANSAPDPSWVLGVASELLDRLEACVQDRSDANPEVDRRVLEALRSGPEEIGRRKEVAQAERQEARAAEDRLRVLRLRIQADQHRLRCLEHLDAIFAARRAR